eukprot:c18734_g1_i1.p1 GENE.c18734_g1_i1~~c18734_g1_i1.p1  ORF type:complete len:469 (+),score=115.76 c18734_g1_i1:90-1409(+)
MDQTLLTPDVLEILLKCLPSAEEAEIIRNHLANNPDDQEKLSDVEQFFSEMSSVPHAQVRVKGMVALVKGSQDLDFIREKVKVMKKVMQEVRESSDLKRVLRVVLAIGNALNAGSNRGGASGFRIDDLTRLKDTKTVDNSMTLLHFVAQKLVELEEHCELDLRVSLPSLNEACEVVLDDLRRMLNDYNSDLKDCSTSLQIIEKKPEPIRRTTAKQKAMDEHITSGISKDPRPITTKEKEMDPETLYNVTVTAFVDRQAAQAVDVAVLLDQVTHDFETFAKSLGEDPHTKPEQLFGVLKSFAADLLDAHNTNVARQSQTSGANRNIRVKRQAQQFNKMEREVRERKNSRGVAPDIVPKLRIGKNVEEKEPESPSKMISPGRVAKAARVTKPQTARHMFMKKTATLDDLNRAVLLSVQEHDVTTMDTAELIIAMTPRLAAS